MAHFHLLVAAGAVLALALLISLLRGFRRRSRFPYRLDTAFLSQHQLKAVALLREALGEDFDVFCRVRVIDVIGLTGRLSRRERELAFDRLDGRFFDFLICGQERSEILCAVNLVMPPKLGRSALKDPLDRVCAAAGLPLVRFENGRDYLPEEVAARVLGLIDTPLSSTEREGTDDETLRALRGLSLAIKGDVSGSKPAAPVLGQLGHEGRANSPSAADPLDELLDASDIGRREPSIRRLEPVDEGPEFRIQPDVDDESLELAEYRQRRRA